MQISDRSYYIQAPAKIGLFRLTKTDVLLIDSGNDKSAGKKVLQILNANGWRLSAIFNTHSNADHIGGNRFLQAQTGCRIFAPEIECAFTRHPILEPSFLYGGHPPKDLQHKFLMAQESDAEPLSSSVLPEGFEIIPLPGHFFDMVGFRTPDDVVFLADCLSSRETLEKYRVGFIYDVGAYLATLETVKSMKAKLFVPSHAEPGEDMSGLAQYNIDIVREIGDRIVEICREPITFEQILQRLFTEYGLTMTFEQHALVGSTVRSYLSWLRDDGRLNAHFDHNLLLWSRDF